MKLEQAHNQESLAIECEPGKKADGSCCLFRSSSARFKTTQPLIASTQLRRRIDFSWSVLAHSSSNSSDKHNRRLSPNRVSRFSIRMNSIRESTAAPQQSPTQEEVSATITRVLRPSQIRTESLKAPVNCNRSLSTISAAIPCSCNSLLRFCGK